MMRSECRHLIQVCRTMNKLPQTLAHMDRNAHLGTHYTRLNFLHLVLQLGFLPVLETVRVLKKQQHPAALLN